MDHTNRCALDAIGNIAGFAYLFAVGGITDATGSTNNGLQIIDALGH